MFKLITIRHKGGSSKYEKQQLEALEAQKEIDAQLEAIDLEFYEMRQENKRQYDENFRPLEEGLLTRAAQPAREATSAEARASEYDAADAASDAALTRRNERMGINNGSTDARADDDYIRSIALTAVGNQSKMSALETQSNLQSAAMGIGVGVNQDIGRTFGNAVSGMQQGLGHADAAFSNYANAQSHMNNSYASQQQGYSALIQSGVSVAGMGISNYQNAKYSDALSGTQGASYGSSWLTGSSSGGLPASQQGPTLNAR